MHKILLFKSWLIFSSVAMAIFAFIVFSTYATPVRAVDNAADAPNIADDSGFNDNDLEGTEDEFGNYTPAGSEGGGELESSIDTENALPRVQSAINNITANQQATLTDTISALRSSNPSNSARQSYCVQNKTTIESKMKTMTEAATNYKEALDTMRLRAVKYYDSQAINAQSYADNLQLAIRDSEKATANITVIIGLPTTLDCSSSNVAEDLVRFKLAVSDVRAALLGYRTSVKSLLGVVEP